MEIWLRRQRKNLNASTLWFVARGSLRVVSERHVFWLRCGDAFRYDTACTKTNANSYTGGYV
jgi:hypothetical protein